jgi:hypothetical protein
MIYSCKHKKIDTGPSHALWHFFTNFATYDKKQQLYSSETGASKTVPDEFGPFRITFLNAVHVPLSARFHIHYHLVRIPFVETGRYHRLVLCGCRDDPSVQQAPLVQIQQRP